MCMDTKDDFIYHCVSDLFELEKVIFLQVRLLEN